MFCYVHSQLRIYLHFSAYSGGSVSLIMESDTVLFWEFWHIIVILYCGILYYIALCYLILWYISGSCMIRLRVTNPTRRSQSSLNCQLIINCNWNQTSNYICTYQQHLVVTEHCSLISKISVITIHTELLAGKKIHTFKFIFN